MWRQHSKILSISNLVVLSVKIWEKIIIIIIIVIVVVVVVVIVIVIVSYYYRIYNKILDRDWFFARLVVT